MEIGMLVSALGPMIGTAAFIFGWFQYKKTRVLELEKFQWEKEREEIKGMSEYVEKINNQKRLEKSRGEYCRYIAQNFEYMDFFGGRANPWLPPLQMEKIYVPLRVEEYLPWLETHSLQHSKTTNEKRNLGIDGEFDEVFKTLYEKSREKGEPLKLVLVGPPGSGKTTLLRWIAYQCVASRKNVYSHFIPVFIPVKELARDPDNTYRSHSLMQLVSARLESLNLAGSFFTNGIQNDAKKTIFSSESGELPEFSAHQSVRREMARSAFLGRGCQPLFERAVEENRVLFLFDGLDEVPEKNLRQDICAWLQNQAVGNNTLIVTCQKACVKEEERFKFHPYLRVFTLREFDRSDIHRYLENFYRNHENTLAEKTGLRDTAAIRIKGLNWCAELEDLIDHHQILGQLAVNPGLSTIIAIIYHQRDRLPLQLRELFRECISVMVQRLDMAFYPGGDSSVEQLIEYLSSLATFTMENNRKETGDSENKEDGTGNRDEKPSDRLDIYKRNTPGNGSDLRTQWQMRFYAQQLPGIPG